MKQIAIFPDTQIKRFNRLEKIKLIFDKLDVYLQPVEITIETSKKQNNQVYFNTCNFDNVQNIKIPFPEFDVSINEKKITIREEDKMKMEFAPNQLLTIYRRILKIKEL
jgi:hypothetical protein